MRGEDMRRYLFLWFSTSVLLILILAFGISLHSLNRVNPFLPNPLGRDRFGLSGGNVFWEREESRTSPIKPVFLDPSWSKNWIFAESYWQWFASDDGGQTSTEIGERGWRIHLWSLILIS